MKRNSILTGLSLALLTLSLVSCNSNQKEDDLVLRTASTKASTGKIQYVEEKQAYYYIIENEKKTGQLFSKSTFFTEDNPEQQINYGSNKEQFNVILNRVIEKGVVYCDYYVVLNGTTDSSLKLEGYDYINPTRLYETKRSEEYYSNIDSNTIYWCPQA